MARYQPPHMRNRPHSTSSPGEPSSAPRASTMPAQDGFRPASSISASRPPRSNRDWSTPSRSQRSALGSSSRDIRPTTRTDLHSRPEKEVEDMEFIQSVSRSGGDGAEGDALKDWGLQERYRKYIDERIDRHYANFPGLRDTPTPAGATDQLESLGSIALLFRKLREGVVASGRVDPFAIDVFESAARHAILARNTAQVISSLSGLVPGLYQAVELRVRATRSETSSAHDIADGIKDINIEGQLDNRTQFASLLLLFYLCHSDSVVMYFEALMALTGPISRPLRSPLSETSQNSHSGPTLGFPPSTRAFLSHTDPALHSSRRIRQYLSSDRFDPIRYWQLSRDPSIMRLEQAVMAWSADRVRGRAWEVMKRAYIDVSLEWAGKWLGLETKDVESWVLGKGAKVEGRRVRLRWSI